MVTGTHADSAYWEQKLETLLCETAESARERAQSSFLNYSGASLQRLILFGSGNLGRKTLAGLRKNGVEPLCFADSNQSKWGQRIDSVEILGPRQALERFGADSTFLVTIWSGTGKDRMADRIHQLNALGCQIVVPFLALYWSFPDWFLPFYSIDLPEKVLAQADRVRAGFALLSDIESKRDFIAHLSFRLLGDFDVFPKPVSGGFYFRSDIFKLDVTESLVDCGAYDGDTIRSFLHSVGNQFQNILAFEPDPSNYTILQSYVGQLPENIQSKIHLLPSATADRPGKVCMQIGAGEISAVGTGNFEVDCLTLDQALDGTPVSFLKMDIEGSEATTLVGGYESIRRYRPILALSAYHKQSDLWELPLQIATMASDYAFYLKQHFLEGWDLVCYAVPNHRRIDTAPSGITSAPDAL